MQSKFYRKRELFNLMNQPFHYHFLSLRIFNHFYRVKLAVDLNRNREVAIKFLKVHQSGVSKRKALDCLHREIKILSDCDHPNIAKIFEASFEGVIVKESV